MNSVRLKLRNHFQNGFSFYFLLFLFLLFGIIVGALLIKALDNDAITFLVGISSSFNYGSSIGNIDNIYLFKISVFFNILFAFIIYLVGLLNLGFIIPLVIFLKGSFIGISVGNLLYNYGWKGFLVSAFGIYPQYLIYIPGIIALGALAMTMSFKYRFNSNRRVVKLKQLSLPDYTILVLLFTLILLIGSIYEGFIAPFFLKLQ